MRRHAICAGSILGLVISSCALAAPAPSTESPASEVSLRWALGAWKGQATAPEAVRADTTLAAGTRLKFLIEPTAPSTVYLILQDTKGAVDVLYHESPRFEDRGEGKPTYIPPGTKTFELDDAAGLDTFFLLASAEPLTDLDKLIERHETAPAEGKKALGAQIVEEIRRQHKAHRDFARPVEKPVVIGGQTRGGEASPNDAIDRLALEVKGQGFYSKTITIGH
jgi:hypothetical protein